MALGRTAAPSVEVHAGRHLGRRPAGRCGSENQASVRCTMHLLVPPFRGPWSTTSNGSGRLSGGVHRARWCLLRLGAFADPCHEYGGRACAAASSLAFVWSVAAGCQLTFLPAASRWADDR